MLGQHGIGCRGADQERTGAAPSTSMMLVTVMSPMFQVRTPRASHAASDTCCRHARREAAETINRRFGEQVYNLWLNWALWGVITAPQVNGVENNVLPGGGEGPGVYFGGRHQIAQLWCDEGDCG